MLSKRLKRNLVSLCLGALVAVAAALGTDRPGIKIQVSFGTAYAALLFFALALSVGPFNHLSGRRTPVSTYVRRDFGIWAGCYSLVHVAFGLQVHMGGDIFTYFFIYAPGNRYFLPRSDAFGLANYIGVVSAVITLGLLLISNNAALRKLGASRWKRLQRYAYAAAITMIAHGFLYQFIERRAAAFVVLVTVITAATVALRAKIWYTNRASRLRID